MEAARHWALGGADPERSAALKDAQDLLASLQAWNAGPEHTGPVQREIERLSDAPVCGVHQDNWDSVMLFCDLGTQWRYLPTLGGAIPMGLDYTAAEAVMRMDGRSADRQRGLLADLKVMEGAALAAWAERRAAAAQKGASA